MRGLRRRSRPSGRSLIRSLVKAANCVLFVTAEIRAVKSSRLGALPCRAAGPIYLRSALPRRPGNRAKFTAIPQASFSGEPSGRLGAAAGAGGDSPLQQQPSMHSLPGVDATRRQELRTNYLHVAEEPHFIIATRLVARREMFRGPSIPFGNDNFPGGISVAVYYRFCSAPSAHASALNLNRSRIGACGVGRYRRRGQVPGGPDRYSLRLCFLFEG
jgi:hypothetical protein